MSIRRSPSALRKNYTVLSNTTLADERLSWEARGLLAYLLSKPDNWRVSVKHLVKISPNCGRVKTYRIIKELEDCGYLTQEQTHDDGGKFGEMERIVHEVSVGETPDVLPDEIDITVVPKTVSGSAASGKTVCGKPAHIVSTDDKQVLIRTSTDFSNSSSPDKSGDGFSPEPVVKSAPQPYQDEFEQVWKAYPRKIGKAAAYKVFVARMRSGVSLQELLQATENYADTRRGEPDTFTMHGSTFFGSSLRYQDFLDNGVALNETVVPAEKPHGAMSAIENFLKRRSE